MQHWGALPLHGTAQLLMFIALWCLCNLRAPAGMLHGFATYVATSYIQADVLPSRSLRTSQPTLDDRSHDADTMHMVQANLTNYCSRFNGSEGANLAPNVSFSGLYRYSPSLHAPSLLAKPESNQHWHQRVHSVPA